MTDWTRYHSQAAHKLLSDNRDLYVAQSESTRDGQVAPFPTSRQGVRPPAISPALAAGRSFIDKDSE